MSRKTIKTFVSFTLCGCMLFIGANNPSDANTIESDADSVVSLVDASKIVYLSEDDLKDIGLTRQDAQKLVDDVAAILEREKAFGNISEEEAKVFSEALLVSHVNHGGSSVMALPVWAAAAIVGCAASVALGEGREQVKNALKQGKSVDEASDIAVGVAVDCVFGTVPGGVIGGSLKSALTKPIKDTLRPHVKKIVADMEKRYRDGKF